MRALCLRKTSLILCGLSALLLRPPLAYSMQSLPEFIQAARNANTDNKEALSVANQREAERGQAWMRLAPVVNATAGPTVNEYQTQINLPRQGGGFAPITITPRYERDATISVTLPLIDLGSWEKVSSARATADAAAARREATSLDVEKKVARAYYQLLAAISLEAAAAQTLTVTESTLQVTRDKLSAGVAANIEVSRALADAEQAKQSLADAQYSRVTAVRSLTTLSGLTPQVSTPAFSDDLHNEAPLSDWEARLTPALPAVAASHLDLVAAQADQNVARAAYLPTLAGNFSQHYTNAAGLIGHDSYYAFGLSLNWQLSPGTPYTVNANQAAAEAAAAREERASNDARDTLQLAWEQIRSQLAKSRAARAQSTASQEALTLTQQRYTAGTVKLLDVSQAERDAFSAEVNRIQADGDLAYARALLRVTAGQSLMAPKDGVRGEGAQP